MRSKRSQKLATFLLHHDNAPCHKSASTQGHIELGFTELHHSTYSPDLAPNDVYLFPSLKRQMCSIRMISLDELRKWVLAVFQSIPKDVSKSRLLHGLKGGKSVKNTKGNILKSFNGLRTLIVRKQQTNRWTVCL